MPRGHATPVLGRSEVLAQPQEQQRSHRRAANDGDGPDARAILSAFQYDTKAMTPENTSATTVPTMPLPMSSPAIDGPMIEATVHSIDWRAL